MTRFIWPQPFRPSFDVLPLAITAISLVVYLLHGFHGVLNRDLGLYSYAGQQVADGTPPYVGLLNRTGPLSQLIPGFGAFTAGTVGMDELMGIRLLFLAISVGCVVVTYLLARDLFRSRLAGASAAAAFLTFAGFLNYASNGPREKTAMVLFLVCVLLALTRGRWLATGIFLALATLTWQLSFVVGATAIAVTIVLMPTSPTKPMAQRFRRLLRVVVGGAIPLVACVVYFSAVGALHAFIDGFVVINTKYPAAPVWQPLDNWNDLRDGYAIAVWVLMVGLFASMALAVAEVRRRSGPRTSESAVVVAVGVATAVGIVLIVREFNDWPDAFVLLPLAAVGIGGIARAMSDRFSVVAARRVAAAWVAVAVAYSAVYSVTNRSDTLQLQRESTEAMVQRLPSNATFLSINAPTPLVLAGKTNPISNQMFKGPLSRYFDDTWPGGLTGFGRWIGRTKPTVVTLGRGAVPPWLKHTLSADYRRVGSAPGWRWFVHKSVGDDTLHELRAALSAVSGS